MIELPAGTAARVLLAGGLAAVLGGWTTGRIVARATGAAWAPERFVAAGGWAAALAGALLTGGQHLVELELGLNAAGVRTLAGSAWGTAWVAFSGVALVGAVLALLVRHPAASLAVALAGSILVGGLGHAAADEGWPVASRVVDALHVLAMGAWAGGLAGVASWAPPFKGSPAALTGWRLYSRVATIAAPTVIASGVVATALRVHDPAAFFGSGWGQWLVAKAALVGLALGIGFRQRGRLQRAESPGARAVLAEVTVFVVVLAVTGALTGSPPPGE